MINLTIDDIFKKGGLLAQGNSNYKERPQQIEAAKLISEKINDEGHVILEGPCGFGKSLTYLVPALKRVYEDKKTEKKKGEDGEKVIIVTSNISLQDQLINKDIPFVAEKLRKVYGTFLMYSTLKGINNFICKTKLEMLTTDTTLLDLLDDRDKKEQELIRAFAENSETGDLNEIDFTIKQDLRKMITCSDTNECDLQRCSSDTKMKCFYAGQKAMAKNSDIIVTNYHMLYAMKSVQSDVIADATIVIMDEVHEAEDILRDFNATEVKEGTFEYIMNQIKAMVNKSTQDLSSLFEGIDIEKLKDYAKTFFENIDTTYFKEDGKQIILIKDQTYLPNKDNLELYMKKIEKGINSFIMRLENADYKEMMENLDAINIAKKLRATTSKILDITSNVDKVLEDKNKVIWVERKEKTVILGYKEVDVSEKFKGMFLNSPKMRCIFTSATISSGNNFNYLKQSLGLDKIEKDRVAEYLGKSPFDLTNQELWYLPEDAVPANDKRFLEVSLRQIEEIINATKGGVLVLFTSTNSMRECKKYLEERNIVGRVMMQGEMSKSKLLEEFKNDEDSNLLATKSFFTGVDIQGHALRCVIIDKLPFETPTEPIQQKLNEEKGAFFKYSLPSMIISLKQGVGRGIRTIDDKCVICILDQRIASAKYKETIFKSFKYKKTATRSLDEVRNFTRNYILDKRA